MGIQCNHLYRPEDHKKLNTPGHRMPEELDHLCLQHSALLLTE